MRRAIIHASYRTALVLALALLPGAAPAHAKPCAAIARELRIRSPAGHVLAARLSRPAAAAHAPVVVMVSGAGPHDRDYSTIAGAQFHNRWFERLEQRLCRNGIASLRFDEVGTGRSTGSYAAHATTETLARDVEAIVVALARRPDVDGTRIALAGHSEGGAIAAMVAGRGAPVAAVVLLAAPAHRGEDVMRFQLARADSTGGPTARADHAEHARRSADDAWYRFFLGFAPAQHYARVKAPLLVLQGDEDVQVSAAQADSIVRLARSGGDRRVYCRRYPSLGHAFTVDTPAALAVAAPEVLDDVSRWLRLALVDGRAPASPGDGCPREGAGPFAARDTR